MAKSSIRTDEVGQPVHTRTTAGSEESQVAVLGIDGSDDVVPADRTDGLSVKVTGSALPSGASTAANQTSIIGYIDGVETQLTALAGYVDGLEGFTDGIETLLTAIRTAVESATPAGTNSIGRVDIASLPALPAGSNAIGRVDVGSALPAGTNNIGDVDVATVPADPFGANADALVAAGAAGSISAKLRRLTQGVEDLKTLIVLGAGSAEIGAVNQSKVAGAAVDANSGNKSAGTQRIVIATDQPQLTNALKVDGSAVTQPVSGNVGLAAQTRGGWSASRLLAAGSTNATSVKRAAGQVGGWYLFNAASSTRYLKLYDKASAPTVGTDTPFMTIPIPAGAGANVEFVQGIAMGTGIAFALTTGVADNDTGAVTANDVVVNLLYA